MKEPTKIKLTDNPENKSVKLTPLPSTKYYDIEMTDDVWIKNEDNKKNNSESVQ
jgi:hypothetical protein